MGAFIARYVLSTKCISVFIWLRRCVYCAVRSAETLYLWAIISLYTINWLVFITRNECVYCVVRSAHTVNLCVFCGSEKKHRLFHPTALRDGLYNRDGVFLLRGTFCPHSVFLCFYNRGGFYWAVRSAETMYSWAIISLHSIEWLVFINEN
jgi:hypothetical protein